MKKISISLEINPSLFLRDPQQTELGRRILQQAILLIDELGLEQFTFRKLAERIESTEASVYRYFENKHLLFVYLLNWYWEWMRFRVDYNTHNLASPVERLRMAITMIVDTAKRNTDVAFVDEDVLHRIVVTEGTKAYHHKMVDEENRIGFFLSYKNLCQQIADLILEIDRAFPYPRALASTLLEMANNHLYFAQHLPRLTDLREDEGHLPEQVTALLEHFAFSLLGVSQPSTQALPARIRKLRNGAG